MDASTPAIDERSLVGFKYFDRLGELLAPLHEAACKRDKAGNRTLHFDQYAALILLALFNPMIGSLRAISAASDLRKVRAKLGVERASLGSLSEAARVFDADLLRQLMGELVGELNPEAAAASRAAVDRAVTLVDGTLLAALPGIARAMLTDGDDEPPRDNSFKRRCKLHTHFAPRLGAPVKAALTAATVGERQVLRDMLEPDRLYVADRGYYSVALFAAVHDAGSSIVCDMPDYASAAVVQQHTLTDEDRAAGVLDDQIVTLGSPRRGEPLDRPMRIVSVECKPHKEHWRRNSARGGPQRRLPRLRLVTDILTAPAHWIAALYRFRWQIEIFFRQLKHALNCRHLFSHHPNGIAIQVYLALIACLLITLWTRRKPTRRTVEMLGFHRLGLADDDELLAHIAKLQPLDA